MGQSRTPAEVVADLLAVHLGPNTARTAVRMSAERAVGRPPEQLRVDDVPRLAVALRPMLRTLLGESEAELLIVAIEAELSPALAGARPSRR